MGSGRRSTGIVHSSDNVGVRIALFCLSLSQGHKDKAGSGGENGTGRDVWRQRETQKQGRENTSGNVHLY